MIKVEIDSKKIIVTGHALWAKNGLDIVCASTSTAIIMTVNQCELLDLKKKLKYEIKEGFASLEIMEDNELLSKIIANLIYTLDDLAIQYPKHLKIEKR